jgi:uncharacterized protein YceH (UPF0502 family)
MNTEATTAKWQAIGPRQRRVLGVLIEKAKTTPDAYPMTLNGLTTGCNQKNNRDPVVNYTTDDVEQALESLKSVGAVSEVQGSGRVNKFRHLAYEWLGVDKVEAAIMAELLLRGEQTVGELRGRASRMEPIADLGALKPILNSLMQKNLVLSLSAEGRGQVVSHNLYRESELAEIKTRVASAAPPPSASDDDEAPTGATPRATSAPASSSVSAPRGGVTLDMFNELQLELMKLRAEHSQLRTLVQKLAEIAGVSTDRESAEVE